MSGYTLGIEAGALVSLVFWSKSLSCHGLERIRQFSTILLTGKLKRCGAQG